VLEVNAGSNGSSFTAVAGYPSSGTYPEAYELTVTTDGLIEGRIYAIRWYA